ncbi:autotransporter-associated beta strand repeat-containing protein [Mesorhizobium sp. ESP7-2]|uniref:autotransporter-associated beta strand repeat-containing protein n=1 Tax=Mesorhizobium sp. ESP7-2 TaxID=2876622 RepID=UPI001CCC8D5A|nr:autotransporter-associated beta strand repeat-containing protein [Mesorhizobium sp. ESP7-2]MBZ9709428.1 autotransporter-associated beta strand repeat-containing protein [Mesorhizobium sp. ESP7-2]
MTKWKGQAASFAPNAAELVSVLAHPVAVLALPLALAAALAAGPADAGTRYWDANGSGSGWGGSGTWNTTNLNWSANNDGVSGPYNQPWNNGAGDDAYFGSTAGTITLGAPVSVHDMTFQSSGWVFNGSTLTLMGATPTITVINDNHAVTINSVVAGTAGLTLAGSGDLYLYNTANTFSGGIVVAGGGWLTVQGNGSLGAATNTITLNSGGFSSNTALDASWNVILAGTATIGGQAGSALITGAGKLFVNDGVTLSNDNNTYVGDTQFSGTGGQAHRYFTSVRNTGEASSLGSGGDIIITGNAQYTDNVHYTGDGDTSDRTFRFSSNNTAAVLRNDGTGTLALTGSIIVAGSATSFTATSGDLALTGTISADVADTSSVGFSGGAGRTITLGDANSYNGFTGVTTVTVVASTLANIGSNSSFGTGNANSQIQINGGTLSYTGGAAGTDRTWLFSNNASFSNNGSGGLTLTGAVQFDAAASLDVLNLGGSYGGVNTISSNITGSGSIAMNGAGTWVLSGNNSYTGTTTVTAGTLVAGGATAFNQLSGATVDGGMLDLGGFDYGFTKLEGAGGQVDIDSGSLTLNVANGTTATYSGTIVGAGDFTKTGAGTQVLKGANTYTGNTTISGGTLELSFAGAGGPTSDIISSSSTLNMGGGTLVVTGVSGEGNSQTFDGLNITGGSNKIDATDATVNFGAVNRTAGLVDFGIGTGAVMTVDSGTVLGGWATVNGSDYATVNGSNQIVAFTDYDLKDDAASWLDGDIVADTDGLANSPFYGTASDAGGDNIVQLGGLRYAAAANSIVTVGLNQTLGVDGAIIIGSSVLGTSQTINGGSVRGSAGGVLGVQQSSAGTFTINSTIVDNGAATGFTMAGTGTGAGTGKVVLGNDANTYTGATWVTRGTLEVGTLADGGSASSIGASGAGSENLVLEAARLRYTGGTASTDRGLTLMRSGAVTGSIVDVSQAATELTVGGEIVSPDGAGLTKEGAGTLILTNANSSYAGVTTVSAGTLVVTSLGDGGANSTIGASGSESANLVIANGATFRYDGATAASDRGFTVGTGGGRIGVVGGTTLTLSGTAAGAGGFTKTGTGTLVLSGTNTYTGGTRVSEGTLRAGSTDAFNPGANFMDVLAGATLDLGGFDITTGVLTGGGQVNLGANTLTSTNGTGIFTGTISGTGGFTRSGVGTMTVSGCNNDYTGATTIDGGALSVGCLADGGIASDIGASSADSANLAILNSGVLQYTGDDVAIDRGITLSNSWGYIDVFKASTVLEFEGDVVGGGALRKRGDGTLILSGTNSYTGGTYIDAGILSAGSTDAFGSGPITVTDVAGVTVRLNDFDNTIGYLSGGGATGGDVEMGSATLTLNWASGNATYGGTISGTGGLVKNGGINQGLSACDSSYTGGTTIGGGRITATCLADGGLNSSIGASSSDAANLVIGGPSDAVLSYVGDGDTTDRRFTLRGTNSYIRNYGTGALEFTNTAAVTYDYSGAGNRNFRLGGTNTDTNIMAAEIDDAASNGVSLLKEEAGTWRLTNANSSYTGVTQINAGVLEVTKLADGGSDSSIGASSSVYTNLLILDEGHLRYVGTGDSTDRLFRLGTGTTYIESSGTGAVNFTGPGSMGFYTPGARTLALGGTYTGDNIMGVVISDQAANKTTLAKNDAGTWILTGNNTYTGNTVINDGKLIIGNGGTAGNVGTGEVILAFDTGVLGFNRSDTFNFAGVISGPGTIEQMGEGTTVLTATNSVGTTKISKGTLQVNGALTTPTIAMAGTSALTVNGTVGATAGGTSTITGGAGASTITVGAAGTLRANGDLGGGSDTVNLTGALNTGAGVLNLGAGNDTFVLNYDTATLSGAGINGGTGGETGSGDTLRVSNSLLRTLDGSGIAGFESLDKQNAGTLILTGSHSYSAGVTIEAGVLQVGQGTPGATLDTPSILDNATLTFTLDDDYTFAGTISGTGQLIKSGTGTTTLTGTNTYAGLTRVLHGTLLIDGDQAGATGQTSVGVGATLGGTGIIGGNVTVANGGALSPGDAGNAPGVLTINGGLNLNNTSALNVNFGQAGVPGGAFNDLIDVGGNLTLDGTLNITQSAGGSFGPGVYRVMNYGGTLTDNTLDVSDPNYFVQTSVAKQVNLVNSAGLALSFWDGNAGPHSNSAVDGGNGTWRAAGDQNWTDSTGVFAAPFANASFAIFQGAAGTVTVDGTNGPVQAAGMQFATNGYLVQGADIALVGPQSIIRVGDGTLAGAAYVATIASNLTGATQLVKTDLGTLVLSGANSYTGGTAINGGTVQVASDGNLGDASGGLSLDGGRLHTTADITSARAVTLNAGGGTFDTDSATSLALNGIVSGAGTLTKTDAGTLVLTGANSYQGGTVINGGTVEVSADANLGDAAGALTFDNGTLHTTGTFTAGRNATLNAGGGTFDTDNSTVLTLTGAVGGAGALTKDGAGTLVLTADSTYGGGTTISAGTLQLGNGGATGSITGDVLDNGLLSFNRSNLYTFDGTISGSGGVSQDGTGNTVLTADNSYSGGTLIAGGGGLYINGDQSAATGPTNVNSGTLGGTGIIGGDVFVDVAGRLAPGDLGAAPGTLTINGSLQLAAGSNLDYSFGQAGVVGGAYNDLTVVHGDLTLDGTINVTEAPGGNFGPGIYRVISYDGTRTDNGLDSNSPTHIVQTSIAGQVNLVDISAMTLNFWDGDAGPKSNDAVNGGNGTWRAAGDDNWTGPDGDINAAFSNGSFAIFAGTAGTVDVDNTNGQVQAAGMQFATDGYLIQGQSIELLGPQATIRVGDGTVPGAGYVATIAATLEGTSQLVKTDLGTLVLGGSNTYSGGTAIGGGTLQVSADTNLGDAAGALSFDNGATLQNTAAFSSARGVTLDAGGGTFQTDADLTLSGLIGGAGGFTKTGNTALKLTGANSYAGPTTVAAGGLYVDGDQSAATGLTSVQIGATLGGKGTIGGNVSVADGATLSPGSADGTPGTLAIAGDLTLSGGSILNYSFGQANVAGGTLNDLTTVGGNLVLDGTLNVTVSPGGSFGPGIYRVFDYSGTLTNNGLAIGSIPSSNTFVQTSVDHQVNLVNTAGLDLNYWDGDAGPKFDGTVNGGNGTWQGSSGNDNWTEQTGVVNAAYSDGAFAIFAGTAGTVTVDNSLDQVTAAGMQFATNGYIIQGGDIGLVGPQSTIRVGDGTSAGAGYTATIASALSGDTQIVKTDAGTLVLTGTNSYTGTAINGGTLRVAADANLGDAAGGLSFNGGTLDTTASFASGRAVDVLGQGTLSTDAGTTLTLNGVLSGAGALTKSGAGTLALTADSSGFTGTTAIGGGTLNVSGSLCGTVNVLAGGRLEGTGTVCDTTNATGAIIAAGNPGVPGTLTIAGDYTGNGGTLEIETVLGGDASATDRLVVTGDTAGTTTLKVANLGGGGAQTVEGIKIIDVGGTSAGTFSLAGDYVFQGDQAVVGGAYAYRLYQNGVSTPADGDWYLRSALINGSPQPLYSPAVPIYEAYAGVLQSLNELGTLQQRIGNRTWGEGATPEGADVPGQGPVDGKAIWARIEAAHTKLDPKTSTSGTDYDVTTWKFQAGVDGQLHESEAGVLIGGIVVNYGTASSDVSSTFGVGSIKATGYGVGGSLTWFGDSGFYVDTQAQATWYDSDIRSATLGTTLADGNNGFGYALSVETGQKVALTGKWSLTPQAQLAYSSVRFDTFTDKFGAVVSHGSDDSLIGRLGVSADYEDQWADSAGQVSRTHIYGIANLYYDFLDGTDVDVSGVRLISQNQTLWGGVGLGGSLDFGDGKYAVFGEAIAKTSLQKFGDSNSIGAKLGFSVRW